MAVLDKKALMDFLEEVDHALPEAIQLVAVGGTALTLRDGHQHSIWFDSIDEKCNEGESCFIDDVQVS